MLASCIFGTCGAAVRSETTPQKQEISRSVSGGKTTTTSRSVPQTQQTPPNTNRQPANNIVPRTVSTPKTQTAETSSRQTTRTTEKTSVSRSTVPTRSIQKTPNNTRTTLPKTLTRTAIQPSKELLDAQSDLLNYCQTQYDECMDKYCNILDETTGRCSCSNNINNYSKTANALKEMTYALQDVAQQIQYIGLSAKEIETLFAETEAEATLSLNSDTSQLKNDLDKIKGMIIDVKSPKSSFSVTDGLTTDLSGLVNFDFDDTSLDLDSIFSNNAAYMSSISNQRGASLYSTAVSHCRADVLARCKKQGINEDIIINTYDLKIDRDCLTYEKSLTEQNKTMETTIRNAENILRKARLMVKQNANTYDLQGCVAALDECMRSEFVCDENYQNCLDPSSKYIANNSIVAGSKPKDGLYSTWGNSGSRPWDSNQTVANYVDTHLWKQKPSSQASNNIADFLQHKIGYNDGKKNFGLCMGVLNQCQNITYTKADPTKSYIYNNAVIKEWLMRVLPMIKKAQDNMLNTYGQTCANDVKSCLTTNGYSFNDTSKNTIAIAICTPVVTTCLNVTSSEEDINKFILSLFGASCEPGKYLNENNECINCDGATYTQTETCTTENASNATTTITYTISGNTGGGGDITSCTGTATQTQGECKATSCKVGYGLTDGKCIKDCAAGTYRDNTGNCSNCQKGSYTTTTNQTTCTLCTPGTTTSSTGSNSPSQCTVPCENSDNVASWKSNKTCAIESCKSGYAINNNKCELNQTTVTYHSDEHPLGLKQITCISGNTISLPTFSDSSFYGWYNSNGVKQNNTLTCPDTNLDLYAYFVEIGICSKSYNECNTGYTELTIGGSNVCIGD